MTGDIQFFKCEKCGNVYEKAYDACECKPSCCGEVTVKLEPQTADPEEQKHVPWIEKQEGGILVKVGKNAAHPMSEEHSIVFIAVCADGVYMRKNLRPTDAPEAFFPVKAGKVVAYEYCNKHGLWMSSQ